MAIGNTFNGLAQTGIWIDAVHLAGFDHESHSNPSSTTFILTRCPAGFWQGQKPERGRRGQSCD
jgi:hypothetical protein